MTDVGHVLQLEAHKQMEKAEGGGASESPHKDSTPTANIIYDGKDRIKTKGATYWKSMSKTRC